MSLQDSRCTHEQIRGRNIISRTDLASRCFPEKQEMMSSLMEWFLDGNVNAPLREMAVLLKTKFIKVPVQETVAKWLHHTVVVMPAMTPPV
jgi:hypothetical protein